MSCKLWCYIVVYSTVFPSPLHPAKFPFARNSILANRDVSDVSLYLKNAQHRWIKIIMALFDFVVHVYSMVLFFRLWNGLLCKTNAF